jgi:hypothetical protein
VTEVQHDNPQWTGENQLLGPEDIIRLDALDRLQNNDIAWIVIMAKPSSRELSSVYYTVCYSFVAESRLRAFFETIVEEDAF